MIYKNNRGGTSAEWILHQRFFWSCEFSYEKCSEIFPEIFEPVYCGSEKIPQNSRQISLRTKKNHQRASAEAQREKLSKLFFHQKLCLQSELCMKDLFWATNFLTKNAPNFCLKFLRLNSAKTKTQRARNLKKTSRKRRTGSLVAFQPIWPDDRGAGQCKWMQEVLRRTTHSHPLLTPIVFLLCLHRGPES